jgi:hypothetical protein
VFASSYSHRILASELSTATEMQMQENVLMMESVLILSHGVFFTDPEELMASQFFLNQYVSFQQHTSV